MALSLSPAFSKTTPTVTPTNSPTLPSSSAQVFTLENGLTLIVDEDRSAPVASVQGWCETGSIDEGKWTGAGLSHILEHMLFKGTDKRGKGVIDSTVQSLGGYINASTSFDRTIYYIDIPADGVAEAVDIVCDVMVNANIPADEYDKEQEVIRREFAMGFDNPDRVSSRLLFSTVFTESPYRHPVIGYLDVYNKLTREDVVEYYKARYVPNNMFLVVVGDVDALAIKDQVEKFFADHPRVALPPVYIPTEPQQTGRREAHEEFPTELTRLNLAWRTPPVTAPEMPALDLLSTVLGGGVSSPLYQDVREDQGLVSSIGAGCYALANEGLFVIRAVTEPGKRQAATDAALANVERIKAEGVSEADLTKARNSLLSSQLGALTTVSGMASDHGSNWLLTRNLNFSRDYLNALNRTTVDDLQRVAQQYLTEDNLTVTSLNPVGSLAALEEQAPVAARDGEIKSFTLPNGLELIVRENHRLPLVSMSAVFKGGVLAETPANNGISALLSRTIVKGTDSRSAREIASAIESVGGTIEGSSGNNSVTVSVDVMKPDLSLGLELLADVLKNATYPDSEVVREKEAQVAEIKRDEDQMTGVARNVVRENLFPHHPYGLRSTGTTETVNELTPKQLRDFHQKIINGQNGVLAVFGNVDADDVYEQVKAMLSELPPGQDVFAELPNPPAPTTDESFTEIREKNQAIVMIGYPGVDIFTPDRAVMELIDTASSDLGSRFFNRIREELGLAYFVGTTQLIGPTPGMLVFYLGTDPAKVDEVRRAFKDEIANLAKQGLTPEELTKAKKKLLGAEAIRDQSDAAMAQAIALDVLFGLGTDFRDKRRAAVDEITVEDTQRVSSQYFGSPGSVEAVVMPQPTPESTPTPSPIPAGTPE